MTDWIPRGLATGIGSMPHVDANAALRVTFENFPTLPYWPQLPKRDFRENMYAQFSEGLPGIQLDLPHEWLGLVKDDTLMAQVEAFYARYLEENPDVFAVGEEYAAGLYALREHREALRHARWIKGQVTGPISFGLKVVDQTLKPMLYDDTLRDVLVKHVARKAQWQEKFLASLGTPIVFVDEPSLALIGASVVALNRDEVVRDLEEIFSSLHCLTGTHCCGNTDWAMLLQTSVNIISFDAYNYAENLALFADDVKRFLERGGVLAWGIVPTVEEELARETTESLVARLDAAIHMLVKKGVDRDLVYARALVTPACGLGTVSLAAAERAFALTRQVSDHVREHWV
jgi:methionine synthase II (cobalamin-independent)